jgi:hypothetical protein
MKFIVSEYAILNENANIYLPNNVGDLVIVSHIKKDSPNYQYDVELPNGDYVPVREVEINKLTKRQREYMTYIQKDNTVIYVPTNEEVVITKTDYLHGQVSIMFEDGGATTVGFESLRESVKKGKNKPERNFEDLLSIFLNHYKNQDDTYTVPKQLLINLLDQIFQE